MLYKVNLYNCNEGSIVYDQEKVDYIIVDFNKGEVREVVSNRLVNTVSYDSDISHYVFNKDEKSRAEQDRYLCNMAPCVRIDDLVEENKIDYDKNLGYNPELTDYIYSLDERFFTKYLNAREEVLNKSYSKR